MKSALLRQSVASPSRLHNYHPTLGQGVLVRRQPGSSREFEEQEIIGTEDTRQKVDATRVPFRWICSLKIRFRDPDTFDAVDFDAGSGLLIGSQWVLTAAHNLFANITGSKGTVQKQRAILVRVYPGRNGDNDFPFGGAEAASFKYHPDFEKDLDSRLDIALIKLKTPIGDKNSTSLERTLWVSGEAKPRARARPLLH
jgi:V8-like Glu-specific endopeptidase